jgi:lipopolysaccharide transport system ATP-binding protein
MPLAMKVQSVSKRFRMQRNRPTTLRECVHRLFAGRRDETSIIWALRDVSFSVQHGQVFGIIGHNGAGKSTLLRLLCGLGRPTSGTITTNGQVSGILELGGGFHPDLTGRQNIETVAVLNGFANLPKEHERNIIHFSELEEFIDQPVRTYSNGMYLRLAFAAAIEFEPAVLIIDEVLAVGDERFRKKCLDRIRAFRQAGKTLIVTSHDAEQIKTLCDEVLVLEEGRVVMQAEPRNALPCYYDLMRQRTEKRLAQMDGGAKVAVPATTQGARQGTQEASVVAVRFYDHHGKPVESVRSADPLIIEIDIEPAPSLKDLACNLGIYSETQIKCFETSVPSIQTAFGPLNRRQTIRYEIAALLLLGGRYFINVGLYPTDWAYVYDFHWLMHPLEVTGNSAPGPGIYTNGVALLDVRCCLKIVEQFADRP